MLSRLPETGRWEGSKRPAATTNDSRKPRSEWHAGSSLAVNAGSSARCGASINTQEARSPHRSCELEQRCLALALLL